MSSSRAAALDERTADLETELQLVQSSLRQATTQLDLKAQDLKSLEADRDRVQDANTALDTELTEARSALARATKEKERMGKDSTEAVQQLEQE